MNLTIDRWYCVTFISNPEEWLDSKIGSSIERGGTSNRWHRDFSFPEERLRRFKDRNFDWNDESTILDQILMKLDGIKMGRSRISVVSIFATKKRMFGRGGCRRNELPLIVASWCRWWCSMRVESLGDFSVAEKGAKESNGFLVRGAWWLSSSVTGFRLFRARLVEAVWQGEKD